MEALLGLVGGVGDELQPRVPRRINTCREDGIVSHIHLVGLPFIYNDGSTVILACVELHLLGIVHLIVVAVDALSVHLVATKHIVVDDALVVVLEATLVDGEFLVGDIRRRDESVADVRVDGVGRDKYLEWLVACPCSVRLCEHFDLQAFAFCFFGQGFPIVDVGLGFDATHHDFFIAKGITRDSVVGLAPQLDGEWRDVHGNGYARVVGIDVW